MQYLTTETTNIPQFWTMHQTGKLNWQPTKAKSEASAKGNNLNFLSIGFCFYDRILW